MKQVISLHIKRQVDTNLVGVPLGMSLNNIVGRREGLLLKLDGGSESITNG